MPYHTNKVFKYWCIIEFVYAYYHFSKIQYHFKARTGISFQNNCHIFKLLIMFDMQYWKCNNICSAWRIKKTYKFSMVYFLKMYWWVIRMYLLKLFFFFWIWTYFKWIRIVVFYTVIMLFSISPKNPLTTSGKIDPK